MEEEQKELIQKKIEVDPKQLRPAQDLANKRQSKDDMCCLKITYIVLTILVFIAVTPLLFFVWEDEYEEDQDHKDMHLFNVIV